MDSKVIVITGASSGIGAALAIQLGHQGHRLVLAARREKELKSVADQAGSHSISVVCDVTDRNQVNYLRDTALKTFDQVDIWVNNAGRGITRPVLELSDDEFYEMMKVNALAALYGMQAIIPHFQQRAEGHLINVSSFLGRVPLVSFRSAYNAAKAALNALTANLRVDLATSYPGIHVSLVMPGVVATDFAKHALGGLPHFGPGGSLMNVQSADEVASVIISLMEHPRAEIYTNPSSNGLALRYYEDVAAFEERARHRD